MRRTKGLRLTALFVALAGCGDVEDDPVVTVQSELLNHPTFTASESVVSSAVVDGIGRHNLVITYNHNDPGFVTFTGNSRQIFSGASLMRFFRLTPVDDSGVSGRVAPPSGWAVLWGDPGITRNRANANRVYMTNLAVPNAKFPTAAGKIEGDIARDGLAPNLCGSYLGGACIARSSDNGLTFTLSSADCVRRITGTCTQGTFYDGSDMETSPEGRVYAAYRDVQLSKSDVYMATSQTGAFSLLPTPSGFQGYHPRIKWGPGGLYLLQLNGSTLSITRYGGGSSYSGMWTSPVNVATNAALGEITLSDRNIRSAGSYDLDIGPGETGGTDARVIYRVVGSDGRHHIRIARCTTGTTISCTNPTSWRTDTLAGEQFTPAIATGTSSAGQPYWAVSYHSTQNFSTGNQTELRRGIVTNVGDGFTRFAQEPVQRPCPDNRGYWGDYDNMATGPGGFTFRGFSNSFNSSCTPQGYTTAPLGTSLTSWTH
jgi:hypothetical protein